MVKYNTNVIKISMCFIVVGGKELENCVAFDFLNL